MRYEIVSCANVDSHDLEYFMHDVVSAGEFCNPLWRAHEVGVHRFQHELVISDRNRMSEKRVAFMIENVIVGVARITPKPNHIENGSVGFYILPRFRKRGYASAMIRMIETYAHIHDIENLTACVDETNTASMNALRYAGWVKSENQYVWNDGRKAVEFVPKPYGKK